MREEAFCSAVGGLERLVAVATDDLCADPQRVCLFPEVFDRLRKVAQMLADEKSRFEADSGLFAPRLRGIREANGAPFIGPPCEHLDPGTSLSPFAGTALFRQRNIQEEQRGALG